MAKSTPRKIHPGDKFDSLTAIEPTGERKNGYTVWKFACSCGHPECKKVIYKSSRSVLNSKHNDCGAAKRRQSTFQDLTGQRFGKLVVLHEVEKSEKGSVQWLCHCDCGNDVVTTSGELTSGNRRSCGCLSKPPLRNLAGQKFGMLTVLSYDGKRKGEHYWNCVCDCGTHTSVRERKLIYGKTVSCGCLKSSFANLRTYIDGTCIEAIAGKTGERKVNKNNTSGVRGVTKDNKSGRWIAKIGFQGKSIHLGAFKTLEEAREARLKAEEKYFDPVIEAWEKSKSDQ